MNLIYDKYDHALSQENRLGCFEIHNFIEPFLYMFNTKKKCLPDDQR